MASMDQRIIETEGPGVALALHVAEVSLTKGMLGIYLTRMAILTDRKDGRQSKQPLFFITRISQ